jgi:hypothetical protein
VGNISIRPILLSLPAIPHVLGVNRVTGFEQWEGEMHLLDTIMAYLTGATDCREEVLAFLLYLYRWVLPSSPVHLSVDTATRQFLSSGFLAAPSALRGFPSHHLPSRAQGVSPSIRRGVPQPSGSFPTLVDNINAPACFHSMHLSFHSAVIMHTSIIPSSRCTPARPEKATSIMMRDCSHLNLG